MRVQKDSGKAGGRENERGVEISYVYINMYCNVCFCLMVGYVRFASFQ